MVKLNIILLLTIEILFIRLKIFMKNIFLLANMVDKKL